MFITLDGMKVSNSNRAFVEGFQEFFNLAPIRTTDFASVMNEPVYQMAVFFDEQAEQGLKLKFPDLEFNL